MDKIAKILQAFNIGQLTKLQAEKELSLILGGSWVLALINGEYIPVNYQTEDPSLMDNTDDYDNWLDNTILA